MKHLCEVNVSVTKTAGKTANSRNPVTRLQASPRTSHGMLAAGLDQEETRRPARSPCLFL